MRRRLTATVLTSLARTWLDQAALLPKTTEGNRRSALARETCAKDLLSLIGGYREMNERGREKVIK